MAPDQFFSMCRCLPWELANLAKSAIEADGLSCFRRSGIVLVAVLACSDDEGARVELERFEFNDEGALCVRSGAAGELLLSVVVNSCASGCARIVDSACEVSADNADLVVHSSITVEERRGPDVTCTAACVPILVSCAPTQVPSGDYLFHHAGAISPARLPTDGAVLLGAGGSFPELQCY